MSVCSVRPDRSTPDAAAGSVSLPASLAYHLVNTLHLSLEEVATLSLEQAVAKMTQYWAKPAGLTLPRTGRGARDHE
jgi:hypothetical protein